MRKGIAICLIILASLLIVCCAAILVMRSTDYFAIKEVVVTTDSLTEKITPQAQFVIDQIQDKNMFEVFGPKLKKVLLSTPCVSSVNVTKYYPSDIKIEIAYQQFKCRVFCSTEQGICYFLAGNKGLTEVPVEAYNLYQPLPEVQISYDYAVALGRWGIDSSYIEMIELVSNITQNDLITCINYVNNKGNDFGCLNLTLPTNNVQVNVREPVTPETLNTAISLLLVEKSGKLSPVYDLYANGLFGRP